MRPCTHDRAVFRPGCRSRSNRGAFTLIELLTVMAIIGVLMGLIIGVAALAKGRAHEAKTRARLQRIENGITEYQIKLGTVPDISGDASQLQDSLEPWLGVDFDYQDAWGNDMIYQQKSSLTYVLYSKGPDGEQGTRDTDADNIRPGR